MKKVLDTHALIAFLEREPGWEKVKAAFLEAAETGDSAMMSSVNFGEFYYTALRNGGEEVARVAEAVVSTLPLEITLVDRELAKEAARFKAPGRIAYSDCFAAALAKAHGAELITGDREFEILQDKITILWI